MAKYLNYCWQLMLRCELMSRALVENLDWAEQVVETIIPFLTVRATERERMDKKIPCFLEDSFCRFITCFCFRSNKI